MEDYDNYCYSENVEFSTESLGDDQWLTGCPLCGNNCWEYDKNNNSINDLNKKGDKNEQSNCKS